MHKEELNKIQNVKCMFMLARKTKKVACGESEFWLFPNEQLAQAEM